MSGDRDDPAPPGRPVPGPAPDAAWRRHRRPARRAGWRVRRGLFYRGSWCPYCNAQLRAFQRAAGSLAEVGAKVVALSVDDEATTLDLIAKHGLTFPVGHSADARAIAQATGAFIHEDALFLQSTGFVLDPAGRVVVSVYSSGAFGRLVPEDVLGMIRYLRAHAAPATSA